MRACLRIELGVQSPEPAVRTEGGPHSGTFVADSAPVLDWSVEEGTSRKLVLNLP